MVKIIVIFVTGLFGAFCLLPYMKFMKERKEQQKEDGGNYNNLRFICISGGRLQSFSTSFACGMITGLAVCHILPETVTSYAIAYAIHEAEHAKEHAHRMRLLGGVTAVG